MANEEIETEDTDTLAVDGEPKSSARILSALKKAGDLDRDYQDICDGVDDYYSRRGVANDYWRDPEYDLFWSSMEILKPAIYARPPVPVVSPQFKDRRPLYNVTAELLERTAISDFARVGLNDEMKSLRDDLMFYNRGVLWLVHEKKEGKEFICVDQVDRKDFRHEPARKWSEVGWVARRAWMTKTQMRKRFGKKSGDAYQRAAVEIRRDDQDNGAADNSRKAGVWEVWHRNDGRVYWVAEGCDVMLDHGKPHHDLEGFYPCPRPAYGTLRRRSLVPVPDFTRYAKHLRKIDELTLRIYILLNQVKLKVLIPAGGDIGQAVEQALRESDDTIFIPVPEAALTATMSASSLMVHLPIREVAEAIAGLIQTRTQFFADFDNLSGISDIMRGETEANETFGAQELKSQYGSVRVRDKTEEIQRVAADATKIAAEMMAENFSQETLLEMAQMEIPTKAEIEKQVKEIEKATREEMKALTDQAKAKIDEMRQQGQQPDPQAMQQAQAEFQQAQQQILAKYAPQMQKASEMVPIEDVMKLLRDSKARCFAFEIETNSTIMTNEMQEKASRNEFLDVFNRAAEGLMKFATLGEAGAKLAGEVFKFTLAPYRAGRELNAVIDEFIEAAPQMIAQQSQNGAQEAEKAMAEANQKIAEAELQKAQAAIAKVQADTASKQQEMQLKAAEAQAKAQADQQRIGLEMQQTRGSIAETNARIQKIEAEIQKMGADARNQSRQQDRDDIKTAADIASRDADRAMAVQDRQRQAFESDRTAAMGERQQSFSERQGERSEQRADRQQSFAERQPPK